MKTQFSRRTRRLSTKTRIILIALGVLVLIGLFVRMVFPQLFSGVTTFLWKVGDSGASQTWVAESRETLIRERAELQAQVAVLTNENVVLTTTLREYEALSPEGVFAGVLARPPLTPYDVLIIGRGSQDGVTVGSYVRAQGGVPVGVIQDVNVHDARVTLFSSRGYETYGWIGEERTAVTFVGKGAGAFTAFVPRETPIVVGAYTYVGSAQGAAPFGVVASVEGDASTPTLEVIIRPFINPFSLSAVEVMP